MKGFAWLASLFTILGVSAHTLVHFWADSSFGIRFFFIVGLLAIPVIAAVDIQTWWRSRAKHHKTALSVEKYMLKLLQRGGSAAIFANNLSWITGASEIRSFLKSEATHGRKICLYVPHHNDLTTHLAKEGVAVKTYDSLDYEPSARFTLLNPDEPGSSLLAIGKGTFPNFYIDEYTDQSHARVIAVARDLLKILEKVGNRVDA
jgi:hypothetical protein